MRLLPVFSHDSEFVLSVGKFSAQLGLRVLVRHLSELGLLELALKLIQLVIYNRRLCWAGCVCGAYRNELGQKRGRGTSCF